MAITLDQVIHLVNQLTPDEQEKLTEYLELQKKKRSILDDIPVVDVGPWPEGLSLRREDMYGNNER
jgi:hypothetical protein